MSTSRTTGVPDDARWPRYAVPGLLLPLLAAMVLLWSTSDRQQHLDKVPVAIVNSDKIVSQPTTVAAGRSLTASLTDPTNAGPQARLDPHRQRRRQGGAAHGAVLRRAHHPVGLLRAIVSTGGDKPVRGQLTLSSNGAASTTLPYISEQVVAAAATALGNQSTQGYLKNVYGGFNQIAQSNQKAATSAGQLADGTAAAVRTVPRSSTTAPTASRRAWTRWPPGPTSCAPGPPR